MQLRFAKVRDRPPGADIDQSKNLLAGMGIGAARNSHVGHACIKRRIHTAVVQVVLRGANGRGSSLTLSGEGIKRKHAVLRLVQL